MCVTWNWLYWLPTPEDEVSKIDSSAKVEVQSKSRKRKRAEHNQGGAGGKQKEEHTGGKKEEEPPFASTEFDEENMATALSVSTVPWPNRYITPGDRFTHVVTVVPDTEYYRRGVNKAQPFAAAGTVALPNNQWPAWLHDVRQWVLFLPVDDEVAAHCTSVDTAVGCFRVLMRASDGCLPLLSFRAMLQAGSPKLCVSTFAQEPRPGIVTSRSPHCRALILAFALMLASAVFHIRLVLVLLL